jgi:murein L,D-transpeptidase YafK
MTSSILRVALCGLKKQMDELMQRRTVIAGLLAQCLAPLPAWSRSLKPYRGPQITRLVVYKERRRLYLLSGDKIIKEYKVGLGFTALGPKQFQGDGKTPEGSYLVDRRNPRSSFHLSIGISYPNAQDRAFAEAAGKNPGGDIFIHGRAGKHKGLGKDWTAGCIAVKDRQMEEIYMMVPIGVQVDIHA